VTPDPLSLEALGRMARLRFLALKHLPGVLRTKPTISASCLPPLVEHCKLLGAITLEPAAALDQEVVAEVLGMGAAWRPGGSAGAAAGAAVPATEVAAAAEAPAGATAGAAKAAQQQQQQPGGAAAHEQGLALPEPMDTSTAEPAAAAAEREGGASPAAAASSSSEPPGGSCSSSRPPVPQRLAALRVLQLHGVTVAAPTLLLPATQLQHLALMGSPGAYPTGIQQLVQQHPGLRELEVRRACLARRHCSQRNTPTARPDSAAG
jgi:hypothetical protein